jgi:hypothetical protein
MLRVEELDLFYGAVQALEGVSLEVDQGSIVTIVGGTARARLPPSGRSRPCIARPAAASGSAGPRSQVCRAIACATSALGRLRRAGRSLPA